MKGFYIAAIAAGIFVSTCLADSIDDAEAKRRGVSVEAVQLEKAKTRIAELEKQIADLKAPKVAPTTPTTKVVAKPSYVPMKAIQQGNTGYVFIRSVDQIIDDHNAILHCVVMEWTKSKTVTWDEWTSVPIWVVMETKGMTDAEPANANVGIKDERPIVLKITGTKRYETTNGGSKTILLAEEVK